MKYFKNTSWLLGEKILRMVIGLFVGIWVARYLGPEQFGLFSYAQSFVGLFAAIATLGLDGIVVRELVKDESRANELIGTAFWLKVIGAIATLLILSIAINFTSNDSFTNALVFIIASATIFQSFNVVDMYFQAKVLSKFVVYANIISLFISSVIKVVLILNNASLIAFAWVILFDSFILACGFVYFFLTSSKINIQKLTFKKSTAFTLLKDSWPLMFAYMSYLIYTKIDRVMIGDMLDEYSVGIYSVAAMMYEMSFIIPSIIAGSISPFLIKEYNKNTKSFYNLTLVLLNYSTLLAYIMVVFLYFFSEEVIFILFGEEYKESADFLWVLSIGLIAMFNSFIRSSYLVILNQQKLLLYLNMMYIFINIILNYFLISIFGVMGAVYATIITKIISLFGIFFFQKTKKYFFIQMQAIFLMGLWAKNAKNKNI